MITITPIPQLYKKAYFKLTDNGKIFTGVKPISEIEEMIRDLNIENVIIQS